MRARDLMADLFGDRPHFVLRRTAADGDVDVHALASRRLDERRHAEAAQHVGDDQRALAHDGERRFGGGVDVEVNVERAIDVVAERVPRVEIDAAEIDRARAATADRR